MMKDLRKDDCQIDVLRIMDRLNELDGEQADAYFENTNPILPKKKNKMLGLNDSREHDFDM